VSNYQSFEGKNKNQNQNRSKNKIYISKTSTMKIFNLCTTLLLMMMMMMMMNQSSHNNYFVMADIEQESIDEEGESSSSINDENNEQQQQQEHDQQCGLYLAISSTSTVDDTNWGIFVGQDIIGVRHNIGHPEIGIIVSNLRLHNENKSAPSESNIDLIRLVDYFEAFFWVPSTAGAKLYEHTNGRAIAAISGPGVLASYSKHMTNADWDPKSTYIRPLQNDRTAVSHPNRGAFSPYYHCQIVTTTNTIKAGSEVFMEYGESWAEKNDDETLEKEDYEKIDLTVQQMIEFFQKYNDTLDDDSRIEIYSFLMKDIMRLSVRRRHVV
jgi:hypothetical protein